MLPATEQLKKRKHDSQAAKKSTEHKKIRFLNMNPNQLKRKYKNLLRKSIHQRLKPKRVNRNWSK